MHLSAQSWSGVVKSLQSRFYVLLLMLKTRLVSIKLLLRTNLFRSSRSRRRFLFLLLRGFKGQLAEVISCFHDNRKSANRSAV